MFAAKCVNLVLVLCDGGEMDDTHKAENALTNELSQDGSEFSTLHVYTGDGGMKGCVCHVIRLMYMHFDSSF